MHKLLLFITCTGNFCCKLVTVQYILVELSAQCREIHVDGFGTYLENVSRRRMNDISVKMEERWSGKLCHQGSMVGHMCLLSHEDLPCQL